jgi:hypothetical protein
MGMRWAGNVARIGAMRNNFKLYSQSPKGRDHAGDLGRYGRIILNWILIRI